MRTEDGRTARLLPWAGSEGKPCYLLTDDHGGYISRVADTMESVQLDMGAELLSHAAELLEDHMAGPAELHYLSTRLTEALRDALRISASRGARLADRYDVATHGEDSAAVGPDRPLPGALPTVDTAPA